MRTAHSLPYRGIPDRDPMDWDPPPLWTDRHLWKHNLRKLRLRAVKRALNIVGPRYLFVEKGRSMDRKLPHPEIIVKSVKVFLEVRAHRIHLQQNGDAPSPNLMWSNNWEKIWCKEFACRQMQTPFQKDSLWTNTRCKQSLQAVPTLHSWIETVLTGLVQGCSCSLVRYIPESTVLKGLIQGCSCRQVGGTYLKRDSFDVDPGLFL